MFYLDGGELVMTHYFSMGNQPHMRLDHTQSTSAKLVFTFDQQGSKDFQLTRKR